MAAEKFDNDPQVNRVMILARDAAREARRIAGRFGDIELSALVTHGIIRTVSCGFTPKEDLTPLAEKP